MKTEEERDDILNDFGVFQDATKISRKNMPKIRKTNHLLVQRFFVDMWILAIAHHNLEALARNAII